jgi:sortase A
MRLALGPNRPPISGVDRFWTNAERAAWVVGIVCLALVGARYVDSVVHRQQALRRFEQLKTAAVQPRADAIDFTLWSPQRLSAWRTASALPGPSPLAVLRIPKIRLEVPVLEGTDELTLNRAVGHIEQTAVPGSDGNAGIAGHRDGFFRGLKDVAAGDTIELDTLHGLEVYRIERTWIVGPDDVAVLDPTPARSLTLVTCYPFYYVGSAPQRFIVRAVLASAPGGAVSSADTPASSGHLVLAADQR